MPAYNRFFFSRSLQLNSTNLASTKTVSGSPFLIEASKIKTNGFHPGK
jgi:hypothetical protein